MILVELGETKFIHPKLMKLTEPWWNSEYKKASAQGFSIHSWAALDTATSNKS